MVGRRREPRRFEHGLAGGADDAAVDTIAGMNPPPNAPPLRLDYAPPSGPARPLALIGMAATAVLAGAVVGAGTNAVNGAVSPTYFVNVMGWEGVSDVWRASIAQGVLEGFVFGVLFAVIFTTVVGVVTRACCTYRLALRYLLGIVAGVCGCWVAGGLLAIALASLSPEFYRRAFIGVPQDHGQMLRYAWVGGSIWGAELGGVLSLGIGLVVLRGNWKRQTTRVASVAAFKK